MSNAAGQLNVRPRAFRMVSPKFPPVLNPGIEDVEKALGKMTGDAESYVVILISPDFFVIAEGSPEAGFTLRYREGFEVLHVSRGGPIDPQRTLDVLARFALADPTWNEQIEWDRHAFGDRYEVTDVRRYGEDAGSLTNTVIPDDYKEPLVEYRYRNISFSGVVTRRVLGTLMALGGAAGILATFAAGRLRMPGAVSTCLIFWGLYLVATARDRD